MNNLNSNMVSTMVQFHNFREIALGDGSDARAIEMRDIEMSKFTEVEVCEKVHSVVLQLFKADVTLEDAASFALSFGYDLVNFEIYNKAVRDAILQTAGIAHEDELVDFTIRVLVDYWKGNVDRKLITDNLNYFDSFDDQCDSEIRFEMKHAHAAAQLLNVQVNKLVKYL